jgi:hypothetical protein
VIVPLHKATFTAGIEITTAKFTDVLQSYRYTAELFVCLSIVDILETMSRKKKKERREGKFKDRNKERR